jgi:hypothetical protein
MLPREELAKLCNAGNAMMSGFTAFFQYLPDAVCSLVKLVTQLLAGVSWHGDDDESLATIGVHFRQRFREASDDQPIAHWIRALPYRRYSHGAYWLPGSAGSEVVSLVAALPTPFRDGVTLKNLTRDDLVRVGFTNEVGAPWLKTQHGVESIQQLFELLFVRMPCGSAFRRGAGNANPNRFSDMKAIMNRLYDTSPIAINRFIGNGWGVDRTNIYYEDFGAVECVSVYCFILLVEANSGNMLRNELPWQFDPILEWKSFICCTGHSESVDINHTTDNGPVLLESVAGWLADMPEFYTPGWYNNRSVALSFGRDEHFEYVIAKNIYSVAHIGFCSIEHGTIGSGVLLPINTLVAISKKRDWGEHFTSWPGISDHKEKFQYFAGGDLNVMMAPRGTLVQDIVDGQNDTFKWGGPQDDNSMNHSCDMGHHLAREQPQCRACVYLREHGLPSAWADVKDWYPWTPQSSSKMMASLIQSHTRDFSFENPQAWLATHVFGTYELGPSAPWYKQNLGDLLMNLYNRYCVMYFTEDSNIEFED